MNQIIVPTSPIWINYKITPLSLVIALSVSFLIVVGWLIYKKYKNNI